MLHKYWRILWSQNKNNWGLTVWLKCPLRASLPLCTLATARRVTHTHTVARANVTAFQDVCVQDSTAHWPVYQSSSQKTWLKTNFSTPPLFRYPNRPLCNRTFHFLKIPFTLPLSPPPPPPPSVTNIPLLHGSLQVPLELKPFRVSVKKEGGSHNVSPSPELKTVACYTGFREIT